MSLSLARLDQKDGKGGINPINVEKGCSPDNAACEGFFEILKNEMFYDRDWEGVSIQEFIFQLNEYII